MKLMKALWWAMLAVAALMLAQAPAPAPVERVWIRANFAGVVPPAALDVHRVAISERFVDVYSAGLSLQSLGALEAGRGAEGGLRQFHFRIPRRPVAGPSLTPTGVTGVFVNGVPIHNPAAVLSYRDQGLWHLDAVAASLQANPTAAPLLEALLTRAGRHSPLIGFALDGYPVYGPYGWDASRNPRSFRSSYPLRAVTHRRVWLGGLALTPAQDGPPVNGEFPLGTFAEDYEFVPGSGDLDEHNGRFAPTPEFPDGTYAYFTATNGAGKLEFPYLVGRTYRGAPVASQLLPAGRSNGMRLRASRLRPRAGEPVEWVFEPEAAALEKVHEQPLHLLVISADLSSFEHVHPEPVTPRLFRLRHTFAKPGRYRLYADSTPAGGAQTVARFEVVVDVGRSPIASQAAVTRAAATRMDVALDVDRPARTGADVTLRFRLPNTAGLEPYLGAWAHVVIVSSDGVQFIHAHPREDLAPPSADPWRHGHAGSAPCPPVIETSVGFRRPGAYKLWFQVQRAGKVLSIPFVLQVAAGVRAMPAPAPVPAGAVRVVVSSQGFAPARIFVPAGRPFRLALVRGDAQNCGSRVVFPALGIERVLAPGSTTLIELPALAAAAELKFACGMGMYRGAVVASGPDPISR